MKDKNNTESFNDQNKAEQGLNLKTEAKTWNIYALRL